jgi:hypothetical protein
MSELNLDLSRYSKDKEFVDPVVRCDACQTLLFRHQLERDGACACGCRRVRNVQKFSLRERERMTDHGIDPAFLALFEEREDG